MISLLNQQTVNYISLDKYIVTLSSKANTNKMILKLKESLSTSKSMKDMRKCSLTKYPKKTFSKKTLEILETPKQLSNMPYRKSKYVLSKGCVLSDIFKKENKPIFREPIVKEVKMYLPLMKSPYKLFEELRSAVDKTKRYHSSNASLIHKIKADYYINRMNKETLAIQKKIIKRKKGARTKEEEDELSDKILLEVKEELKLKKEIRVFLGAKDSKFNQAVEMIPDKFFAKLENRINFREDVYIVPLLMCKLSKYPVTRANQIEYFNIKNNINPGILRYLYSLRVCTQKEKDDCENTMRRKTKIAPIKKANTKQENEENDNDNSINRNTYNNINSISHFNPTSPPSLPFYQNDVKSDYLRLMKAGNALNGLNIYEVEDFFIHKYIRYEHVQIASEKEKDCILNNFSNISYTKYQTRHIPKVIASLN